MCQHFKEAKRKKYIEMSSHWSTVIGNKEDKNLLKFQELQRNFGEIEMGIWTLMLRKHN